MREADRSNKSNTSLLATLLSPATFVYNAAASLRLNLYSNGNLKSTHLSTPVISIGNITCGGTGKTPITIDLAKRLLQKNKRVAILSRGYRRKSKDKFLVVSAGQGPLVNASDAGDEPFMIAQNIPEAIVIVGSKRLATADVAIHQYGADVILLDDGFQHLPLGRLKDIVLIDYNDDLQKQNLLPAGRLREPLSSLSRANWIVITKVPKNVNEAELTNLKKLLSKYAPEAKITSCRFVSNSLHRIGDKDSSINLTTIAGKKVIAFCGIAQPRQFYKEITRHGAEIVLQKSFPDHHWYTHKDMSDLKAKLLRYEADLLVTTAKDAVRLLPDLVKDLPIMLLTQEVEWIGPIPDLDLHK